MCIYHSGYTLLLVNSIKPLVVVLLSPSRERAVIKPKGMASGSSPGSSSSLLFQGDSLSLSPLLCVCVLPACDIKSSPWLHFSRGVWGGNSILLSSREVSCWNEFHGERGRESSLTRSLSNTLLLESWALCQTHWTKYSTPNTLGIIFNQEDLYYNNSSTDLNDSRGKVQECF